MSEGLAMVFVGEAGVICVPCWVALQGDLLHLAASMRPSRKTARRDVTCAECGRSVGRAAAERAAGDLADKLLDGAADGHQAGEPVTDLEKLFAVSKPIAALDIRQTEESRAGGAEVVRVPVNEGEGWQRSTGTWSTHAEAEAAIWRGIDWRPFDEGAGGR